MLVMLFLSLAYQLAAQIFVGIGDLKVGIKVTKDDRIIPIDSLCSGFDPITQVPINFLVPEGSSVGFIYDSLRMTDLALEINNEPSKYLIKKEKNTGFSRSSSPGSTNSFVFIDKLKNDTLKIEWKVGYDALELVDLFPSREFSDYVSYTMQNIFAEYPDSSRYNWDSVEYINNLDARGLPISPKFPYNTNGLYFAVSKITEDAFVQLKGFHNSLQQVDKENPYELFLYENLAPGNYEFIAKPYEDAPESLWLKYPFTIKKPWWKTNRAFLIYGAVSFALLYLIIIFIIVRVKNRKQRELKWKQQLTNAELKAIRAQLNPHFLFNSLSSIQNLVAQHKNESANEYITKLSRLLRQVLSSSERQFQELEEELQLIQLYLEIEQLRFPFAFEIEIDEAVDKNTLVPVMLLQPYVENAIKHGIAGHTKGLITINIGSDQKQLLIIILDNGPGLSAPNGNSKGLELGKERLHYLNNVYAGEASVEIKNRTDIKGVKVQISLPLT